MSISITINRPDATHTTGYRLAFDAEQEQVYTINGMTTNPTIALRSDLVLEHLAEYLDESCQDQIRDIFESMSNPVELDEGELDNALRHLELELYDYVFTYEDAYGTIGWLTAAGSEWIVEDTNESMAGIVEDTVHAAVLDGIHLRPEVTEFALRQVIGDLLDTGDLTPEQTAHMEMLLND